MGDNQNADVVKKSRTKKAPADKPTGTSKGKRGRKESQEVVHESDITGDEGPAKKKVKEELASEDEKPAEAPEVNAEEV